MTRIVSAILEREAVAFEGWGLAPLGDHPGTTSTSTYTEHCGKFSTSLTLFPLQNLESSQVVGKGSTMADPFDAAVYVVFSLRGSTMPAR